jgi:DnaJ-class molecular chaperone
MNTTINHYDVLQLQLFASIEDVKTAFKKLTKLYHPDKNPEAEEKYKLIVEAKEILTDEEKKKVYDNFLRIEEKEKVSGFSVQPYNTDVSLSKMLKIAGILLVVILFLVLIFKSNK